MPLAVSPTLPGSVPWLAGVGRLGDGLLWVFDPASPSDFTGVNLSGQRTVVVAPGDAPAWGILVDRVESLIEARRTGPREGGGAWPREWCDGCLLADGRRALLITPQRLLTALAGTPEAA